MNLPTLHRFRQYATVQNGALALGLLIAISWVWGTVGTLGRNFELQQQVDQLDSQVELARLQNQNLTFQQNYYQSQEYLELSARELLGRVAPGERVIILPDSRDIKDTVAGLPMATVAEEPGNFSQWLDFFFSSRQQIDESD